MELGAQISAQNCYKIGLSLEAKESNSQQSLILLLSLYLPLTIFQPLFYFLPIMTS